MENKILIYDDGCPLCAGYTNVFVKCGLLNSEGRKNFSSVDTALLDKIDVQKSVNEIPLLDTSTNQVWYGIDALLELLQYKLPFIKVLGNYRPVKWALKKLYNFISYNRRVIVAAKKKEGGFDCTPDFKTRYRLVFLFTFLVFNTLMLAPLYTYILKESIFQGGILSLQTAHYSLVLLNILIALLLKTKEGLEYLGQVNMIALTGILLCIPLMLFNRYGLVHSQSFNNYYLGFITVLCMREYARRFSYLGYSKRFKKIIFINAASVIFFAVSQIH